ncbi:hypothetical protein G9P44_000717 [Scheffersomyces stipitis]|nr:hypothetical protein G9P44_000717 [Scheffersomyces stipitis]
MDSNKLNDSKSERESSTKASEGTTPNSSPFPQSPPRTPPPPSTTGSRTLSDSEASPPSSSSSPTSPFQLPSYILRNLTPVKKSKCKKDYAEHRRRRANHISKKKEMLKHRSLSVIKKVHDVREQRRQALQQQIGKLELDLKRATSRRHHYLQTVKERAGNSSTLGFRMLKLPSSLSEENENEQEQKEKHNDDSSRIVDSYRNVQYDMSIVTSIQRLVKTALYKRYLNVLKESGFLDCFTPFETSISYAEGVRQLNKPESRLVRAFVYVLQYLQVPDPLGTTQPYSGFLYAFILLSDYTDCISGQADHPGFNSNLSDSFHDNSLNNFLWLLIFKHANEMIENFKTVVAHGTLTTEFLESWKNYSFLFSIFKYNHFFNLISILDKSIEVTNKMMAITDDGSVSRKKADLEKEHKFLERFRNSTSKKLYCSEEVADFLGMVENELNSILYSPLNQGYHKVLRGNRVFSYHNFWFYFPRVYGLENSDWRQYWFLTFKSQKSTRQIPEMIRSGHASLKLTSKKTKLISIQDVLQVLGKESYDSQYELMTNSFLLGMRMKNVYAELYKFYRAYSKVKMDSYHPNNIGLVIDSIFIQDGRALLVHYFKLVMNMLKEPCQNSELVILSSNCLDLLEREEEDSMAELVEVVKEFEISVANLWINQCIPKDFVQFQKFENAYILTHAENFSRVRSVIYTNSPNLFFPNFYKFLKLYKGYNQLKFQNHLRILHACFEDPKLLDYEYDAGACKYFVTVFTDLIVNNRDGQFFELDELNSLFIKNIKELNGRVRSMLVATACLVLLISYSTNMRSCGNFVSFKAHPKEMFNSILLHSTSPAAAISHVETELRGWISEGTDLVNFISFREFYLKSNCSIEDLLLQKFNKLVNSSAEENLNILQGNFKYCQDTATTLWKDIGDMTIYIYRLYGPLLNWIYGDLGRPMDN